MSLRKILCVFGTRPEAIKMAPVVHELRRHPEEFETRVILTAQHREMLDQVVFFFKNYGSHEIRVDGDLKIMRPDQRLPDIVKAVLDGLTAEVGETKYDLMLVHGDTLTTFAAALWAFYHRIAVGHVEAGLRSYDLANPFPEESNRVLTDHLCALHFAPTPQARRNLLAENIREAGIFVTGNTVIDALRAIEGKAPSGWVNAEVRTFLEAHEGKKLILMTAHRRENFGRPLENIFRAVLRLLDERPETALVYPVHMNPNVREAARRHLNHPRVCLCDPVLYHDLVGLMKRAYLVVTDSGGIQEEAPALGKPVLVLRKVTERPEAVKAGTAKVIGVEEDGVYRGIRELLDDEAAYRRMANAVNPYGDGRAAQRIFQAIRHYFGMSPERPSEWVPS